MEQPKYSQKPSIPAVEVSPRPLEGEIEASPSQKEPNSPAPIDLDGDGNDAILVDQNGLRVTPDEGGKAVREITEPTSRVARPEQK